MPAFSLVPVHEKTTPILLSGFLKDFPAFPHLPRIIKTHTKLIGISSVKILYFPKLRSLRLLRRPPTRVCEPYVTPRTAPLHWRVLHPIRSIREVDKTLI